MTRKISNSEVLSWNACRMQYYYVYDLGLSPTVYGEALSRGLIGHEALGEYYTWLITNPTDTSGAKQMAMRVLAKYIATYPYPELLTEIAGILHLYWELQDDSDWEIVAVERVVDVPMTDDFSYALKFDLLVKLRSTGKFVLVDHKFTYDFWSHDDVAMSPQFPKYQAALRAKGIDVAYCILNQLRYRKIKVPTLDMCFKRTECVISKAKMTNAMSDQIKISKEITTHRELLTIEAKQDDAVRSLVKPVCKYCVVKPLCMAEFDGGDITYMAQNDFTTVNESYGYNKPEAGVTS